MRASAERASPCVPVASTTVCPGSRSGESGGFAVEVVRLFEEAEFHGLFDVGGEAAAAHEHGAAVFSGQFQHGADAADVAGEERNDDAALHFGKNGVEVVVHLPFGQGVAGIFHVGESASSRRMPLCSPSSAKRANSVTGSQASSLSSGAESSLMSPVWRILPTGVSTAQSVALGNGMADRNEVEGEAAQRDRAVRGHGHEFHAVEQAVFLKLMFHKGDGEGRAVDAYAAQGSCI